MTVNNAPRPQPVLPWLIALLCVMAFAFQGTRGLWEPDEGRYSAGGVHMAQDGDWLVPTLDGVTPHLTKPPVTYWALAASFKLLGYNEWAARLPSALAYIGTGLFLFGLGRRLCPRKPWVPSVVWALSFAPVIAANVVSTDPLLVLFETAAMYAFVEAQARAPDAARKWYLGMWLAWGLAFMTKGPPGLLPLIAMTVMFAIHDRARLRALYPLVGVLLFLWSGSAGSRSSWRSSRTGWAISWATRCTTASSPRRTTAIRNGTAPSRFTCPCCSPAPCRGWWSRSSRQAGPPMPGSRCAPGCASATRSGCCSPTGCWCRSRCSSSRVRGCNCTCCRCSYRWR